MNLQSSFTYDNFGRRTSRTLQLNNTTIASAGRNWCHSMYVFYRQ